jgi:hypothetical protein
LSLNMTFKIHTLFKIFVVTMETNMNFYKNISKNNLPLTALLKTKNLFSNVPKSWSIVVTDIESSKDAVAMGFHNDVNLSATGSIITVLNMLKKVNNTIKIPYFLVEMVPHLSFQIRY